VTLGIAVSAEAEDDIHDAADWYDDQQPGLGTAFLRAVEACLGRIARFPGSAPILDQDIHAALLHRFPYRVHYVVEPDRIEVFAVWHTSRDPAGWRGRVN